MQTFVLLVLLFVTGSKCGTLNDYCKIKQSNTPCIGCERASQCGQTDDQFNMLTDSERAFVLAKHNELRSGVANGSYTSKHLQSASRMDVMSYDLEIEFIAACHIKRCDFHHDKTRITLGGVSVGQNMFLASDSKYHKDKNKYLEMAVKSWFGEIKFLTSSNVPQLHKSFRSVKAQGDIGHLTQMIWAESNLLGCAYIHFVKGKMHSYFVVCNYAPAGNILGKSMYATGNSMCKEKNNEFPGLCGKQRPLAKDQFRAPINLNKGTERKSVCSLVLLGVFLKVFADFL